jgi:phosphomannomutase / phosphoglucomutase
MNRDIFRAYDVRGLVETELTPEIITALGRAFGSAIIEAGGQRVAVGRDCRLSSPALRDSLIEGITAAGVGVVDVGEVPTPLLYFAVHQKQLDGGVMITGSHNPPEYNGFKMLLGRDALFGDAIQGLADRIEAGRFSEGQGVVERFDITPVYLDWVTSHIEMSGHRLKVVVDGGNGMGGPTAVALYERLGVEVVPLFIEPDGNFPNHHPDPTVEANLEHLIASVRAHDADLGIGYDGDGDRIGVIDERGEIMWGDRLMILLSRSLLAEVPGATIVAEVKCSQTLFDDVTARGGNAVMWKTGHSFIKAKMKEDGALLAGEMSGHIFYKHRYFGYDDAIYTGARLLELLSKAQSPLSSQLNDVPHTFATPELRIDCPEHKKFAVAEQLAARFAKDHTVITVDGVRVIFPDKAWALVRASNTQPVLVLRVEANTPERRDALESWLRAEVAAVSEALP